MTEYPSDWDTRRKQVYQRDDYECQNCGRQGGPHGNAELHAHHIVPKASGGTHRETNLVTVCQECHDSIHNDVEAPTADSVTDAADAGDLDKNIVELKLVQNFTRVFSRGDEDYLPPLPPVGLYMYTSDIYFDTYEELISFAMREEKLPEELHERYRLSREICLGLLGETEDIPDYEALFKELTGVVSRSQKPREEASEIISMVHADTLHDANAELKELERDDAPYDYTRFLNQSEELFDVFKERFLLYDEMVSVTEYGVPTLTASTADPWKFDEIGEDLEYTMSEWQDTLQKVGNEGAKEVKNQTEEGCFIATAAVGGEDHEKVSVLRDFRDNILKRFYLGQLFIRFYYWGSPPIADWIRKSKLRKYFVRTFVVTPAYWFAKLLDI